MSRPHSAKNRSSRPLSAGKPPRTDGVSYEDLLVAQYLEELKKSPQYARNPYQDQPSPYTQKLSHTHIVPTPNLAHRRPQSAHVGPSKPKVDPKFIADPDLWDPTSPRDEKKRKTRPVSAPVYKRPLSATYGGYNRPTSAKSAAVRARALYKRQPHTIVVTAYKNGNKDVFCYTAAPSIKMLLEYCTEKLSLPNAARRIFLEDGTEVFTPKEMQRGCSVYVSMGEPFKNPFRPVKKQNEMSKVATWTMNGVVWPQDSKKKATKPKLSKRFKSLVEQSRRRVLVFKNGHGSQGTEIVADPDRFEDFLVACTARLDMGTYARFLYDWEGQEINRLEDAPVLDQCLQTWSTPVLGPLWVSKGEGFSPAGVEEFLKGLITYTQAKLKEAKHYKTQLHHGQNEDTKEKVDIVAILSMSESEIEETLEIVEKDIEDFTNALNRLKEQREKIQPMLDTEATEGYEYKLKHIEKINSDHRMIGTQGLRLKVFENGTYENPAVIYFNLWMSMRGVGHDKDMLMTRLLDQCSQSTFLANPKKNPAIRPVASKLYDISGQQIKSVMDLEFDQEVWLSFGEPFKNLFTYVLTATFDSVSVYDRPGGGSKVMKEPLRMDEIEGQEKGSKWETWLGLPPETQSSTEPAGQGEVLGLADYSTGGMSETPQPGVVGGMIDDDGTTCEISPEGTTFLRNKENPASMLFASLVMDIKTNKMADVWPADAQKWLFSRNGHIYNKAMPQLVLAVLDTRVKTNLGHPTKGQKDRVLEGVLVGLQKKQPGSPNQQWRFTPEASICSTSHPDLFLTYLGAQHRQQDSQLTNEHEQNMPLSSGQDLYLAVCDKIDGKDNVAQRWAIKQEKSDNIGEWKKTRANPEWHKKAYSWPVKEDGEINEEYDWPMEGYMIPYAPSLKKKEGQSTVGHTPLRLLVVKNGIRDTKKALAVVGPDLTNMRKDLGSKDKKGQKQRSKADADTESINADEMLHCDENLTVHKLGFVLFLERCTTMLDLPFAARRMYDESGKEHFSLMTLTRDQLVYVSCGEPWTDPNVSKAEQQRRYLLSNLSSDVDQIRQFIALRNPENLVLEIDGSLNPGNKLTVNECGLNPEVQESREKARQEAALKAEEEALEERERQRKELEMFEGQMTAHDIAHRRAEDRLNKLKWPWERVVNGGYEDEPDPEEQNYSNKELYRKFKSKPKRKSADVLTMQKFVYEDGFISSAQNSQLVLGLQQTEGRVSEVVLAKRHPDDIHQRWVLQDNGLIQAKYNAQMVLTVSLPSGARPEEDGPPQSYRGCFVTVQTCREAQFGRANQRWHYDESSGFIHAFYTDNMDKEITAANKANVCTFAVMGDTAIDQPGYVVIMQDKGSKSKKLLVCSSCARAMRGRHKLEKVKGHIDFACSMGNAKELGVKQVGSFQCLNGKVDLSSFEAEHTLEEWEGQLERWREELSVRTIAKEMSAAKVPYTVKILAYRNGEGRMKPGEVVVGSSIPGMLEQCTNRMGLSQAARRLYTSDGTLVLDTDDLVEWAREEYVRQAQRQLRAEARAKRREARAANGTPENRESNYLDKVELDSEFESSEEEEGEGKSTVSVKQETGKLKQSSRLKVKSSKTRTTKDTVSVGYDATERSEIDPWSNVVIIPNPHEHVEADGHIVAWNLYANKPGQVCLQVFRPSGEEASALYLTGQVTYDIPSAGEHVIDLKDQPVRVLAGDRLGFYSSQHPIIPYDIVEDRDQSPYYVLPRDKPKLGDMLMFEMFLQSGSRKYSFNAQVEPDVKEDESSPGKTSAAPARSKPKKRVKIPNVDLPPVDMVLKYPIETWVSNGEQFIEPERVEENFEKEQHFREERSAVSYELGKEKHILRQMQGRRYDEQRPGAYKATRNPHIPVLKEGHWQDPTLDELKKHDMVNQLETHLAEMRSAQKPKGVKAYNAKTTRRLYTQPAMKRVLIFPNGESLERAQYVWGESITQLCSNATTRLGLRKAGKYLFTLDGTLIDDIDALERDQLICVSAARTFLRPKESQQVIEIKANWGRARKQYGRHATDIVVTSEKNQKVDVDPFGPSKLAGGPLSASNRNRAGEERVH